MHSLALQLFHKAETRGFVCLENKTVLSFGAMLSLPSETPSANRCMSATVHSSRTCCSFP